MATESGHHSDAGKDDAQALQTRGIVGLTEDDRSKPEKGYERPSHGDQTSLHALSQSFGVESCRCQFWTSLTAAA